MQFTKRLFVALFLFLAAASTALPQVSTLLSVNPRSFGAKCDGVTDDTTAFQKAHDSLPSNNGGVIVVPISANSCLINGTVAFTKQITLQGGDYYSSSFTTTGASNVMFTTTVKLVVQNVQFSATGAAIGTAVAIKTLNSGTPPSDTVIFNSYFQQFAKCYWSQRTAALRVHQSRFVPAASGYGLYLENPTHPDEGDSFVIGNYFAGGTTNTGIFVASTSGLHVVGNKFNGGGSVTAHIDIAPTSNAVGDYDISGNSFEGQGTAAIRLIATSGSIVKTTISGNQFSGTGATHIIVGNNARFTTITGNVFNDANQANGIGIDLQTGQISTSIVGNHFNQIGTAIKSTATISGETIKDNRFHVDNGQSATVGTIYLAGENGQNSNNYGSDKDFEVDRFISNTDNVTYVNAFQLKGDCIVEVFVTGVVQGAGGASKYRKVLVTSDTTVTDLIALVSVGSAFDLQVTSSGGFTVIGIKRNGATGTSVTMQVRIRVTGYPRDISKV